MHGSNLIANIVISRNVDIKQLHANSVSNAIIPVKFTSKNSNSFYIDQSDILAGAMVCYFNDRLY